VLSLVYPSRTRGLLSVLKTTDDVARVLAAVAVEPGVAGVDLQRRARQPEPFV
jgi:hypothetical protein